MQANHKPLDRDVDTTLLNETTPLLKGTSNPLSPSDLWRSAAVALLGALELGARTAVLSFTLSSVVQGETTASALISPAIYCFAWFYAAVKPAFYAFKTLPLDLLAIHFLGLLSSIGTFYHIGTFRGNTSQAALILQTLNAVVTLCGLALISSAQLHDNGTPQVEDGLLPAVDDYVTLWDWISFRWMSDFISIGTERSVEEEDVWQLTQLLRARTLMAKFRTYKQATLFRRLIFANALDLVTNYIFSVSACS